MKLKFRYLTGLLPLALLAPATAEVIYSNYQNITGSSLTWTAVPEPTSMLAGLLLGAGWLRRRR